MASAVATPLERQFGRIAGVTQMTSTSQIGSTSIALQFDLNRNIDAAGRDVQAAINAARSQLPSYMPGNPTYRKVNPADAPILILSLTSDTITLPAMYDVADSVLSQKLAQSQRGGAGICGRSGGARGARGTESQSAEQARPGAGCGAHGAERRRTRTGRRASSPDAINAWAITDNDQIKIADKYRPLIVAYQNGARGEAGRRGGCPGFGRGHPCDRAGGQFGWR